MSAGRADEGFEKDPDEQIHLSPAPLRGVKLAMVALGDDGSLRFGGLALGSVHNAYYDALDQAVCSKGRAHRVPGWDCSCGFHVAFDLSGLEAMYPDALRRGEHAVLDVEVWGSIVEHEQGLRSKHQQVRQVEFAATCTWCTNPSVTLATSVPKGAAAIILVPACERCHDRKGLGARSFGLEEVSGELGAPVCFSARGRPDPRPPRRRLRPRR